MHCAPTTLGGESDLLFLAQRKVEGQWGGGGATREENTSYRAWRFVTETSPLRPGLQCGVRASYFDGKSVIYQYLSLLITQNYKP